MKHVMFVGDFNGKVNFSFDLMYQRNLIPTTNKQTRVGKIQQRLLITS